MFPTHSGARKHNQRRFFLFFILLILRRPFRRRQPRITFYFYSPIILACLLEQVAYDHFSMHANVLFAAI